MSYMRCRGVVITIACLLCAGAWSQEAYPDPDGSPVEFLLNPIENEFSTFLRGVDQETEIVFRKEPEYSGDKVYRNAICLSRAPLDFIGLACDMTAGLLYIDRNRNLDLTDDGPGLRAADLFSNHYVRFAGVHIERTYDDVPVSYTLDTYFFGDYSYSLVRSGWAGVIEIDGTPCVMRVADNMNGVLGGGDSFRFDHNQNWDAQLSFGRDDNLDLPKWLWFEGRLYCMGIDFRSMDGYTALAVSLTPVTENLMDIAFEGQFVSRVMMANESGEYVLLDWPQVAMRIPVGRYSLHRVDLLDSFVAFLWNTPEITAENNVLKTGGPVKQIISASREGVYLKLNHSLQGEGRASYLPDTLSGGNRARFEVYQGERRVGEGHFEYG